MISAVMIDDNEVFLEQFHSVVQKIAAEEKWDFCLDTVTKPDKILEADKDYDIYFFDIVMPDISGIELARQLRNRRINKEFVFVSSFEQHIRDSMAVKPCGFIRKSCLEEDLRELFSRLRPILAIKGGEAVLKNNRKDFAVRPSQIVFISSYGHYLRLMYADGTERLIRDSMKAVEEGLERFAFLRVSNRCVINLQYLQRVDKKEVVLTNGYREKITGTYMKNASRILDNWENRHVIS